MNDRVPGWYRLAWFLGRAPDLTTQQWRLLGLVAAVSLFEQYDMYLFALNLKQIQSDLNIPESQLGLLGAIVRAGAFFAIILTIAADHWGRRSLLMITVLGYTLFTGATAFAPNTEMFVSFQFLSRAFAAAEVMLAAVVIAEEFPPENRGWGIGALAALQACGAGLAAVMFGFVDVIPFGWRALYVVGLAPLLLIAYWRRTLPETQRFESVAPLVTRQSVLQPILALLRYSPRRMVALFSAVFAFSLASSATGFFAPKYLQDVHLWSPGAIALLNLIGGALAIIGNPLAGWLSDRFGRKPITCIFAFGFTFLGVIFYTATGAFVPMLWVGLIFFVMGTDVTLVSYGTELFPTRSRSTANGLRGVIGTLASIIGLSAVSGLFMVFQSNWLAIAALCSVCVLVPLIVWLFLPETSGRTLEQISPDEGTPG